MTKASAKSLASIDMLAGLPPAVLEKLEQRCAWRQYAPHEQIIDRDSESREIFFVTDGHVRVNHSITGREVSYDDVLTGGFFGELGAIDGGPRSATVVSQEPTTIAALPAKAFLDLIQEHPEIALVILRRLTQIVRQSTDRIMDLSTRGANNRVYAELLRLARKNGGGDENEAVIAPVPIHADIASRVSTTRETVARVLSNLAKSGLVTREKKGLVIHDVEELELLVEEFRET